MEALDVEAAANNLRIPPEALDAIEDKTIISKRSKQHKNKRLRNGRQVSLRHSIFEINLKYFGMK